MGIKFSGILDKDIDFLYDVDTNIACVIDKKHNIRYKGHVSSLEIRTEFIHGFTGQMFPEKRVIDVSLEDYGVVK